MKKPVLLVILLLAVSISIAEEAPKYNFATMQAEKDLFLEPGETHILNLYFFNIHGNRITHVKLDVVKAPKGWNLEIIPKIHNVTVKVSGVTVTKRDNLYVEPTNPVPERGNPEEGVEYITVPATSGYVKAKVAKCTFKVPENAPLGETYEIEIRAVGSYLGQQGMVILSQVRNFRYTIKTITREYNEEVIEENKESSSLDKTKLGIIGVEIIGIIALIYVLLYLRKK